MSSSKLFMEAVAAADDWDGRVRSSPQGSLFSERFYLAATGRPHALYWVRQGTGTEIKAGVAVMLSDDGRHCELDDLVIYGGILFALDPQRQKVKLRHDEFQITEFVAEFLAANYLSSEFQLAPSFADIRPFLWYRYGEPAHQRYAIDVRYTSCVDISSLRQFIGCEEESPCFAAMETVRRYSVREARKKGGQVVRADSAAVLVDFYRELMQRQDVPQGERKLAGMRSVINALLQRERGAIYHVLNAAGIVVYAVAYGWDSRRGYYLFGAGHPRVSESWQGTLVHWEAFKDLAQHIGLDEVDLEGVNSPQRGWFKLGLGGDLRPYFKVSKGPPDQRVE
jgi:hypothetical protein